MRTPTTSHSPLPSQPSTRSPYAVHRTLVKRAALLPVSRMSPKPLASKTFIADYDDDDDEEEDDAVACDVCGSRDGVAEFDPSTGTRLCEDCLEESNQTRAAELNLDAAAKDVPNTCSSWADIEDDSTDDDLYGAMDEDVDEEDEELEYDKEEEEVDNCPDFVHRSLAALELGRSARDQEELSLNRELMDAFYNTEVNRELLAQKPGNSSDSRDEEKAATSSANRRVGFSQQGRVRFFDSTASMADTYIKNLPLEIKDFDGQSGHQASYIGFVEEEDGPLMDVDEDKKDKDDDMENDDDSRSTVESDDDDDGASWETSIRDLMSLPRESISVQDL
ncbi:hypothetical protein FOL47_007927 [Perkinsus chesapeaki]|uniref:Uncharacterized protein n=1 Tax=Perkinsus chesapeaki TaxID=330153 RepID=A0A7J6MVV0_PERCH|nr:hypothetical protein FOL47_007927 [Perkinsus chesapeaki]